MTPCVVSREATYRWLLLLTSAALCLSIPPNAVHSIAQETNANAPGVLPVIPLQSAQPARQTRTPQLSDLTLVKLDRHAGALQLILMLESFRTDKRTGRIVQNVPVVRTRMVEDGQGRQVEQIYTVQVPVATEQEVDVKIPAGNKPVTRPASQFRFFKLSGDELTLEAAAEKLQSLQPAFVLDRFVGELPEIPELYRQALKADCLVIVSEEALRDASRLPVGEILPARVLPQRVVPR